MNPSAPQLVDLGDYLSRPSEAERELARMFRPKSPLVIFDIGACEGEESIRFARHFPRARIFAFEPLAANQRLVRENFGRYGVTSAELIPLALSDRSGPATFHISSGRPPDLFAGEAWNYGNKSSSLLPPAGTAPMFGWIEFKETVTVECDTLDHFCARRSLQQIDFIHMDVQGAESLVLAGATAMLPRVQSVWLEVANKEFYRGQKLRAEIEAFMRLHGFALMYETVRGDEGDQFYVNRHTPAGRRRLAWFACEQVLRKLRRLAGTMKRRLLGASAQSYP